MTWQTLTPRLLIAPKPGPARPAPRGGSSEAAKPHALESAEAQRVDPYLWLADALGFTDHAAAAPDTDTAFEVAVEVADAAYRPGLPGLQPRAAHAGARYFTARATAAACRALIADPGVRRVQLAQAIIPGRPRHLAPPPALPPQVRRARDEPGRRDGREVLLGIVDNGCPFAHADFIDADGHTRVLRLWNQNDWRLGAAAPAGFGYGFELGRAQLDALRAAATDAGGRVDEQACYRAAGLDAMRRRMAHGAHLAGLLAGARRWRGQPATMPPSTRAEDIAARSDLVFVQLPQPLLDAVSTAALESRALDAIRYIERLGRSQGYARVLVAFSYESWVGPHDGSSWFERALDSLIHASQGRLQVVTIAGNGKARQVHACVDTVAATADLQLAVPPDSEVPTFVELWVPDGAVEDLRVELTPPGGPPLPALGWGQACAWPGVGRPELALVMHASRVPGTHRRMLLLRIAPTRCDDARRSAARHGIWRIRLLGREGGLAGIDAYIGRSEADAAAPRRAHQARFVGRSAEQARGDTRGTLNGHACGAEPVVAGAFYPERFPYARKPGRELRGRSAEYSGAGPSHGTRGGPDYSVAVDEGLLRQGRLGIGTRSGSVQRLSGSSVAAPLVARAMANGEIPPGRPARKDRPEDTGLGRPLLDD